ncbi:hypothetical protein WICPIJ_007060 [Wickerhamomyces pijperi]|uniref:Glycosyltransferase family 71 protein n=1 Tax=Wickerhamomyces pijperi TaxID=599730 RepID=A0A9P8Q3A4_WICPI|nr:hypothetical protein WICPIJ_007060 [Wickerhamomyces pijperi]
MNPLNVLLRLTTRLKTSHGLKLLITLTILLVLALTLYTLNFELPESIVNITNGSFSSTQEPTKIKTTTTEEYQDGVLSPYQSIINLLSPETIEKYDIQLAQTYEVAEYENQESSDKLGKFIKEHLIAWLKETKPGIKTINDVPHYKHENKFKVEWNKKIPVLDGKLREDSINDPIRTKEYLSSFLQINQDEFQELQKSHATFSSHVTDYLGDETSSQEIQFQGDGILYVGGGKFNWLVLLSLKQLRNLGSIVPVEVFIPIKDERKSSGFCEELFPKFNAKCIFMSQYFPSDEREFINNVSNGYQYKSLALFVSSFERVLMLDSDNFALTNPDLFFVNEPFKSHHFLIWPDFWRRSVSPSFYELAGIEVSSTEKVRDSYRDGRGHTENLKTEQEVFEKVSYHDLKGTIPEASSEAGQLLVNKKVHLKSILMSVYYNFNGPKFYYPLLAQGQAGEGDKDTFIAAAHYWNLPYYQIGEYVREFGDPRDTKKFQESGEIDFEINAMGQYDPILDYLQSLEPEKFKSDFPYDSKKNNYYMHKYKESKVGLLHTNLPKLYPWELLRNSQVRTILDVDGNKKRLYTLLQEELGYDMELQIWEIMQSFLCDYGSIFPETSEAGVNRFSEILSKLFRGPRFKLEDACKTVSEQVEFLKSNTQFPVQEEAVEETEQADIV